MAEKDLVVVVTEKGQVLKFDSNKIPERNRGGSGVKLMKLQDGDRIVGVTTVVEANE